MMREFLQNWKWADPESWQLHSDEILQGAITSKTKQYAILQDFLQKMDS